MDKKLYGSQYLRVAMLLAVVGGFLDAYTFVSRGGVFANAQTGNIVMLGIAFASGKHDNDFKYIIPILAFLGGILSVMLIEHHLKKRRILFVRRSILIVEMIVIAAVSTFPLDEHSNMAASALVSFIAAMQMEAFKTFRGEPIATTISTGNLRKFTENLFLGLMKQQTEKLRTAGFYLAVILSFICGACLGALLSDHFPRASVLFTEAFLCGAFLFITVVKRKREG